MSREQLTNYKYVKPVSDVWTPAATFYASVTGEFPREHRPDADPLERILNGEIMPIEHRLPSISHDLSRVINTALEQDPSKRYESASQFLHALREVPFP